MEETEAVKTTRDWPQPTNASAREPGAALRGRFEKVGEVACMAMMMPKK